MNEAQEQILAWCYQQSLVVPHIFYCTGPHRFGPYCRDCSGMTSEAYKSAGIRTGLDTGAIARDVVLSQARFVPVAKVVAAELLMRRSGSTYNGGSDEHVGIFVRNDGDYIWTWESAGSQNGHGLYRRRQRNTSKPFWRDAVHYLAIDSSPTAPPNIPEDEDMPPNNFFCHTDETTNPAGTGPGAQWWLVDPDANTRIKVLSPEHQKWLSELGGVRLVGEPGKQKPDLSVPAVPSQYLYQFIHVTN